MGNKVVITGGAGFVGSHLGRHLHEEGFEVCLLDDLSFGRQENIESGQVRDIEFYKCDIRSDEIRQYLKDAVCIFHFAALSALPVCQSEPSRAISVNVAGTANVLESARQAGVGRVIFASTSAVYENSIELPCSEDQHVNPRLIYPISKLHAEHLCEAYTDTYGMEITILRYSNLYGPQQDWRRKSPPLVGYIIKEALAGNRPRLFSDGLQKRNFVFIDDVIELTKICLTNSKAIGETFNVGSSEMCNVQEVCEIIGNCLKIPVDPIFQDPNEFWDKYPSLFENAYPMDKSLITKEVTKSTAMSNVKVSDLLGWQASTSLSDGLERTVQQERGRQ